MYSSSHDSHIVAAHGLQTHREEKAFTVRPKIQSQSQMFWYGRSIFCLPHPPNFSDIFDLCLHWDIVRVAALQLSFLEIEISWNKTISLQKKCLSVLLKVWAYEIREASKCMITCFYDFFFGKIPSHLPLFSFSKSIFIRSLNQANIQFQKPKP